MLRVFAIAAVLAAFGATLYFSGDYLQAWETPEPPANAAPAPPAKKKAKKKAKAKAKAEAKHAAPKAKKLAGREGDAAWLTELNAFCIRSLDELDAIEPPASPEEIPRYLRQLERTSTRVNRGITELVRRSGDAKTTRTLRRLFDQDEALVRDLGTAVQNGDVQGLRRTTQSAFAIAKAENRLLTRLGSIDCTLEPDAFDLPY